MSSSVRLLFSTTQLPFSLLIRAVTWSQWSHVALVDIDAGTVIEAAAGHGVREVRLEDAIARASSYQLVDLPSRNPVAIITAARSQIGKPYDWSAIAGIGMHRDWQEEDAWFCSELVAWAAAAAGEEWFRCSALRRVLPQHLWMLPPQQGLCSI
ncbi:MULTISPECIES: YiiX/YebB-like N1pC/P60 family cysteine hydrolase [unclassified Pseudomonas]|uniref:YiiX/YebB-like N1pC/P60 family cysteine hydrolase n=1 Tax=unclassified Pseudomonas TaxID=196821 RepID=UPI00244966B0|nr:MULTISPECIES: YiiX/YebB-like N1pC/P60 family cysteine hydrolase [unclassified Pseudomonas]MDH0894341.1 YiiX/YebB-like N1pC/P60 family cysteine hydrolase [Pseudomonas sp. GD03875]MDH1063364.1 YiiX/YebB-like N1pC/P60 family cysteine hydrolase [Pseudomonas sp. GD03985]